MLWLLTELSNSHLFPIHFFRLPIYCSFKDKGTGGILGLVALRSSRSSSSRSFWNSILWIRPLGMIIDCVTVLFMRLLNTSTLCNWDDSILVMLCFFDDIMRIFILIKNMLQFSPSRFTSRTWGATPQV